MSLYIHRVPGRIRLKSASLRNDPKALTELAELFRAVAGVDAVRVTEQTGSLVIRYRGEDCEPALERAIAQLDSQADPVITEREKPDRTNQLPALAGKTILTTVVQVLAQQVTRKLLERALLSF